MSQSSLQESIEQELAKLSDYIGAQLAPIAALCVTAWQSSEQIDQLLLAAFKHLGNCQLLYAVDCHGVQQSANISAKGIDTSKRKQNLSVRPYMKSVDEGQPFSLSPVYVDITSHQPCITGIHKVRDSEGKVLGCVAADFALTDLPNNEPVKTSIAPVHWRQIKGDPAIRKNLFQQERVTSAMDERLTEVNDIITDLLVHRGIFHAKLHYSGSRATLWLYSDPHRYRLHVLEEIINPSVCLAYPRTAYPADAIVSKELIKRVFSGFRILREADNTIYLRAASLNIINGMVGLTFSCDGSHYMSVEEFIYKEESFWFG